MKFLTPELVSLSENCHSAEEAIRKAGELLVKNGYVQEQYVENMVESYRKHGAYIVITPRVAIPHALSSEYVITPSISLIQLQKPVTFGHPKNDPVNLIFALAGTSGEEHLRLIQKIVTLLNKPENINRLCNMQSYNELKKIVEGTEER